MKSGSIAKIKALGALAVLAAGVAYGANPDASKPGQLLIDNPTIHNLAFRWLYEGDANANASADVRYRIAGADAKWRAAQPLIRVRCLPSDEEAGGPMLAGSILDLPAATTFEVELSFKDPDGGKAVQTVTVATRAAPVDEMPGRRSMHVYPETYQGRREPGFASLREAFAQAEPGDLVWIHPGVYEGAFNVTASGTEIAPIIFRGIEGTVIDGGGNDENSVINIDAGADYIWFEHLSIRSARRGIRGEGNRGIVIRRCRIDDVRYGIAISGDPNWNNADWYVGDNVLVGRYTEWNIEPGDRVGAYYGAGIAVAGRGHVVAHNEVRLFLDGISTRHVRRRDIEPGWAVQPDAAQHAIDIYGNDVRQIVNNAISIDYTFSNIRVMRNRVLSCIFGLSAGGVYSGPAYFIRNGVMNMHYLAWRLMSEHSGVRLYHNTTLSFRTAIDQAAAGHNTHFMNNILAGEEETVLRAGGGGENVFDHNGYYHKRGNRTLIRWLAQDGEQRDFTSLADFSAATGQETGGREITMHVFAGGHTRMDYPMHSVPRRRGWMVSPEGYNTDRYNFRLQADGDAVAAGAILANINHDLPDVPRFVLPGDHGDRNVALMEVNENYTGAAPDLGAYELGKPVPHYGPRPVMSVPSIAQFYGISVRMYFDEGDPRVRAFHGAYSGLIDVNTLEMLEGDLPATGRALTGQWIEQNREALREMWKSREHRELPELE